LTDGRAAHLQTLCARHKRLRAIEVAEYSRLSRIGFTDAAPAFTALHKINFAASQYNNNWNPSGKIKEARFGQGEAKSARYGFSLCREEVLVDIKDAGTSVSGDGLAPVAGAAMPRRDREVRGWRASNVLGSKEFRDPAAGCGDGPISLARRAGSGAAEPHHPIVRMARLRIPRLPRFHPSRRWLLIILTLSSKDCGCSKYNNRSRELEMKSATFNGANHY
jgi:hypothetical protein